MFKMKNETYDFIKKLIQIYVPAAVTLFIGLVNIWHWDVSSDAIVATVTAITTFLGVILNISSANYKA